MLQGWVGGAADWLVQAGGIDVLRSAGSGGRALHLMGGGRHEWRQRGMLVEWRPLPASFPTHPSRRSRAHACNTLTALSSR